MGKPGRLPSVTVKIYSYGFIRFPASFNKQQKQVRVRWEGKKIIFSLAPPGEVAYTPHLSRNAKSATMNIRRVLRLMGVKPKLVAGEYSPVYQNRELVVQLKGGFE